MAQQPLVAVENNFTKGLVTEFTGLNFPENAATDCDNCEFTLVGNVTRRLGIDYEDHNADIGIDRSGQGVNTFKWNNAGGDGLTQVLVTQVGGSLLFWKSSDATEALPLSRQQLSSTITLFNFRIAGVTFDETAECQFSDGNGYLFVYHPSCDPFYCTYNNGVITGNQITVKIRDFAGITEPGVDVSLRPTSLSNEHLYNLKNQGWSKNPPWSATSTSLIVVFLGSHSFIVNSGLPITNGDLVTLTNTVATTPGGVLQPAGSFIMSGTVTGYSGNTLTINATTISPIWTSDSWSAWTIASTSDYITSWNTAIGNYPSNADVWWYYKNSSDVFDPTTTVGNVTSASSNAPRGHYIVSAFAQQRSLFSGISGLTDITTTTRPKNGTWFQGRVWYTGVDAQQPATGDASYYTWTENIYFSQVVQTSDDFGNCFQANDPTSETLFDLLPTDGGVIKEPGTGSIFKLFPIQNGLLVFAANGIWFITGSQGIGFSANDYTITKISSVQSISSSSFVNVNGLPYFWNEEGIYSVQPSQQGSLTVEPITVGTILSFYNEIPTQSKKFARGDYHPIDYVIQWIYKDVNETDVTDRYSFNKILNFNTYNKAFYPYTVANSTSSINGINYISSPGGSNAEEPVFKYLASNHDNFFITFAKEFDPNFIDWTSDPGNLGISYTSYFVTGYRLHGQAQRRIQIPYIITYSRGGDTPTSFKIQALWDYATTGNSGRWSTAQLINNWSPNFSVIPRRHRLRGQGLVLQLKVTSVDGKLFDLMGWSTDELINQSV